MNNPKTFDKLEKLEGMAKEKQTSSATLALAWLLRSSKLPRNSIPVIGPRKKEHIDQAKKALELPLTAEECDIIDKIFI
jgi:aryl-alcohol dehydrogenase-like predicted oxidoreductase